MDLHVELITSLQPSFNLLIKWAQNKVLKINNDKTEEIKLRRGGRQKANDKNPLKAV